MQGGPPCTCALHRLSYGSKHTAPTTGAAALSVASGAGGRPRRLRTRLPRGRMRRRRRRRAAQPCMHCPRRGSAHPRWVRMLSMALSRVLFGARGHVFVCRHLECWRPAKDQSSRVIPTQGWHPRWARHVMRTWGAAEGHPLSPGSSLRTCYTDDDSPPASPAAPVLEAADDACWWQDNQARPDSGAAWRALRAHMHLAEPLCPQALLIRLAVVGLLTCKEWTVCSKGAFRLAGAGGRAAVTRQSAIWLQLHS